MFCVVSTGQMAMENHGLYTLLFPRFNYVLAPKIQLNRVDLYLILNSAMVVLHRVYDDLLCLFLHSAKEFDQLVVDTWRFAFVGVD